MAIFDALKMAWKGVPWDPSALDACLKFNNDGPMMIQTRHRTGSTDCSAIRDISTSLAFIRFMGDRVSLAEHTDPVGELPLSEVGRQADGKKLTVRQSSQGGI